jgi:Mrp family chromosome partitioning ATPase
LSALPRHTSLVPPPSDDLRAHLATPYREIALEQKGKLLSLTGLRTPDGQTVNRIMITSGLRGEGKTTIAIMAAMVLGASPRGPALLIDANFCRPMLHTAFGLSPTPGLADIVMHGTSLDCVCPTEFPGLNVLLWGDGGNPGANVFVHERFTETLAALNAHFPTLVLDAASVLDTPEMLLAVPGIDGVLEVIRCEQTAQDVPASVKARVERAGGTLLGLALNRRKYHVPRQIYKLI